MSTPLRPLDTADVLKTLLQTTTDLPPENSATTLTDFVPAPTAGSDDVTLTDSASVTTHSSSYLYNNSSSLYAAAQWS